MKRVFLWFFGGSLLFNLVFGVPDIMVYSNDNNLDLPRDRAVCQNFLEFMNVSADALGFMKGGDETSYLKARHESAKGAVALLMRVHVLPTQVRLQVQKCLLDNHVYVEVVNQAELTSLAAHIVKEENIQVLELALPPDGLTVLRAALSNLK